MTTSRIPVVGLVGGIGSGKSSVAAALSRRMKTLVLDADQSGHAALREPAIRERLIARFGSQILNPQGNIDRRSLATLVFGPTAAHRTARTELEGIVQPWIRRDLETRLEAARRTDTVEVILLDAPVLLESGWDEICDAVAYIDTPLEMRLARVEARGWDAEELLRREQNQMPLDEKRGRSDVVIPNAGEIERAAETLEQFVRERLSGRRS